MTGKDKARLVCVALGSAFILLSIMVLWLNGSVGAQPTGAGLILMGLYSFGINSDDKQKGDS